MAPKPEKINLNKTNNYQYKLSQNDFRFLEKLLYEQKTHDTAIAAMEAEIVQILETLLPGGTGSFVDLSSPKGQPEFSQPEAWAIKREENLRIKYLRGRIEERKRHRAVVSEAMKYMDETESQLIFLRYNEEKSHSYCARKLSMWDYKERQPTSTYWRARRRILEKVAKFAGLV